MFSYPPSLISLAGDILPITVNSDEYDAFQASHLSFSAVFLLSRFHPAANIQTLLMVMQLLQMTC
jgi:hypothetical protein